VLGRSVTLEVLGGYVSSFMGLVGETGGGARSFSCAPGQLVAGFSALTAQVGLPHLSSNAGPLLQSTSAFFGIRIQGLGLRVLSVYLSVCLSVCLYVCLSACLSVCLSVCLPAPCCMGKPASAVCILARVRETI
jgi:hypothetical protein